jgi:hypothetical protein
MKTEEIIFIVLILLGLGIIFYYKFLKNEQFAAGPCKSANKLKNANFQTPALSDKMLYSNIINDWEIIGGQNTAGLRYMLVNGKKINVLWLTYSNDAINPNKYIMQSNLGNIEPGANYTFSIDILKPYTDPSQFYNIRCTLCIFAGSSEIARNELIVSGPITISVNTNNINLYNLYPNQPISVRVIVVNNLFKSIPWNYVPYVYFNNAIFTVNYAICPPNFNVTAPIIAPIITTKPVINNPVVSQPKLLGRCEESRLKNGNFTSTSVDRAGNSNIIPNWNTSDNTKTGIAKLKYKNKDIQTSFIKANSPTAYLMQSNLGNFVEGGIYTFSVEVIKKNDKLIKCDIFIMSDNTRVASMSTIDGRVVKVSITITERERQFIGKPISVRIMSMSKGDVHFTNSSFIADVPCEKTITIPSMCKKYALLNRNFQDEILTNKISSPTIRNWEVNLPKNPFGGGVQIANFNKIPKQCAFINPYFPNVYIAQNILGLINLGYKYTFSVDALMSDYSIEIDPKSIFQCQAYILADKTIIAESSINKPGTLIVVFNATNNIYVGKSISVRLTADNNAVAPAIRSEVNFTNAQFEIDSKCI